MHLPGQLYVGTGGSCPYIHALPVGSQLEKIFKTIYCAHITSFASNFHCLSLFCRRCTDAFSVWCVHYNSKPSHSHLGLHAWASCFWRVCQLVLRSLQCNPLNRWSSTFHTKAVCLFKPPVNINFHNIYVHVFLVKYAVLSSKCIKMFFSQLGSTWICWWA